MISPEAHHPKRFKAEKRKSCMENRIGFKTEELRKEFFWAVREATGMKSWDALASLLGLHRSHFQGYQYGEHLLPEKLFIQLISFLSEENQCFFRNQIFTKPGNWGASKGGRKNFEKNGADVIKRLRAGFQKKIAEPTDRLASVNLSQPLSKELCEFIGAIIGDGSVDGHLNKRGRSKYHIFITGDSKLDRDYLTKRMASIVKNLFDVNSCIYFRKDKRAMTLNLFSKRVFALFTRRFGFVAGNKTYTVEIPEEILQAGEEFVFPTIRGIFDTDGCVFFDKRKPYKNPYPRVTLQIASKPLFLQLKTFLEKHFSLYTHCRSKPKHFTLEVYGHKQFEKWMQLIGFSNQRHLNRIREGYKLQPRFELGASTSLAIEDTNVAL